MDFYSMLAKKYAEIFPVSDMALSMASSVTPAGGSVLDIGSADGQYIGNLRKAGYKAFGLEFSADMIKDGYTAAADMTFPPFKPCFDTVLCLGNTLAHADHYPHASLVTRGIHATLKDKGRAIIQILNYEKILTERPSSLPTIKTQSCVFERLYSYEKDMIKFTGKLTADGKKAESSVSLYPITPRELLDMGFRAGFRTVEFFSDYDRSGFDIENSFMLIALMSK